MHADVCAIKMPSLGIMTREEAVIDDLVKCMMGMIEVKRLEKSRRHAYHTRPVKGDPLSFGKNSQMAFEVGGFQTAGIR
jgi:hypothetical protein